MIIYGIHTQKDFDKVWQMYKDGTLELVQTEQSVGFFKGSSIAWQIDHVMFYHYFDTKKHGPDPLSWGK